MTRATWIGHSTVLIETAGQRILTDPVLGNGVGPIRRRGVEVPEVGRPDVVLISHLHHDHLNLASLRLFDRDVVVLVPIGGGSLVRSNAFRDVRELDTWERADIGGVGIEAVPARHAGSRLPLGPRAPALGYRIEGEHRIYFAGDTDIYPEMADLGHELDLAILPVGGWGPTLRGGHMDPARAAAALRLLQPRWAIAIHWGTLWPIGMGRVRRDRFNEPALRFAAAAKRVAPEVSVVLLAPGEQLVI